MSKPKRQKPADEQLWLIDMPRVELPKRVFDGTWETIDLDGLLAAVRGKL